MGRTALRILPTPSTLNFNSLAPRGANHDHSRRKVGLAKFQLTRPAWGEPSFFASSCNYFCISTHSPRVGRTALSSTVKGILHISTHSPRVGRTRFLLYVVHAAVISTHSPRVGRTYLLRPVRHFEVISTHSPRVGRTRNDPEIIRAFCDFNSLAPRGANRLRKPKRRSSASISTHSPRVGRTVRFLDLKAPFHHFNSLAPRGANQVSSPFWASPSAISTHSPRVGRTALSLTVDDILHISTHSPRVGRTQYIEKHHYTTAHFNSLAPRGANPRIEGVRAALLTFQLTRPAWGEPHSVVAHERNRIISTHSPRVGRTQRPHSWSCVQQYFNSLAPRGANLLLQLFARRMRHFNSLAPRGANLEFFIIYGLGVKFQLTRPAWGEPDNIHTWDDWSKDFNSLAPRGANLHIL